jgi:predicted  nucleic acid-binding Zn-ribbon protein
MQLMRSTWTDSRLDDLNHRVTEIRDDVRDLRGEMRDLRGEMRDVRGEIGALKRTMIQVGGGLVVTLIVGMLGLLATQI